MEIEILNTLETIRGYLFVIMITFIVWVCAKLIQIFTNILERWLKAWDGHFDNSTSRLIDEGAYDEAIEECKKKLSKLPNHVYANWHIAKAYYFLKRNDLAEEHFNKVKYLVPSWESDADEYIKKIKNR